MKKFISILCVLTICVCTNAFAEFKAVTIEDLGTINGDFLYFDEYTTDESYIHHEKIYRYVGNSDECILPENSYVCSIGTAEGVECVVVSKGVVLDGSVFHKCTDLKEVVFTEVVSEIPDSLFSGCKTLEKVVFAEGTNIKSIGEYAFSDCENLKTFDFTYDIETIKRGAFRDSGLSGELKLTETLKSIEDETFYGCKGLTGVRLPNGLKEYKPSQWGLNGHKSINIPDSVIANPALLAKGEHFDADEVLFNGDMTIDIYRMVEEGNWCQDKYLKGKTDKSITITDDFVIVDDFIMKYTGDDRDVIIPEGIKGIYNWAFMKTRIDSVKLPDSLETIGEYAFFCSTIKKITIPQNVKSIGGYAFSMCYLLEELTFDGAPEMGEEITYDCLSLKNGKITFNDENIKLSARFYNFTSVKIYTFEPIAIEVFGEENLEHLKSYETTPTPKPTDIPDKDEPTTSPIPTVVPTDEPTLSPKPETSKELTVKTGGETIEVYADNEAVEFTDVMPFIDSTNRTQMPVRAVAEALECKVDYIDGLVIIKSGNDIINLTIGSDILTKNGENIQMDTAAVIISDRTFIPVRYIAEALDYTVKWESE